MECVSYFTWKLLAWLTRLTRLTSKCIHLTLLKDATKLEHLQAAGAAIADRSAPRAGGSFGDLPIVFLEILSIWLLIQLLASDGFW